LSLKLLFLGCATPIFACGRVGRSGYILFIYNKAKPMKIHDKNKYSLNIGMDCLRTENKAKNVEVFRDFFFFLIMCKPRGRGIIHMNLGSMPS
jgi:hypothetical protein